jgi:hypothetical protein
MHDHRGIAGATQRQPQVVRRARSPGIRQQPAPSIDLVLVELPPRGTAMTGRRAVERDQLVRTARLQQQMALRSAAVQVDGEVPAQAKTWRLSGKVARGNNFVHQSESQQPARVRFLTGQQQRPIGVQATQPSKRRYPGQRVAEAERAQYQNRRGHQGQDGSTEGQMTSSRISTPRGRLSA